MNNHFYNDTPHHTSEYTLYKCGVPTYYAYPHQCQSCHSSGACNHCCEHPQYKGCPIEGLAVTITDLEVEGNLFAGGDVTVRFVATNVGVSNHGELHFFENGIHVGELPVNIEFGQSKEIRFTYTTQSAGEKKLTVSDRCCNKCILDEVDFTVTHESYIGTGSTYSAAFDTAQAITSEGRFHDEFTVTAKQGDYFFLYLPHSIKLLGLEMGGFKMPFDGPVIRNILNVEYDVYTSRKQYNAGTYKVVINTKVKSS